MRTAYNARDGHQYVSIKTVIEDSLSLDYVAFLAAIHDDFDPTDQRVTVFRQLVAQSLAYRGSRGGECWDDDLDEVEPDDYTAAKAMAMRAYGFDVPTDTMPRG